MPDSFLDLETVERLKGHILLPHQADWSNVPKLNRVWRGAVESTIGGPEDRLTVRPVSWMKLTYEVLPFEHQERAEFEARMREGLRVGKIAVPFFGRGVTLAEAGATNDVQINIDGASENVPRGTFLFIQSSVPALYADWDLCFVSEVSGTTLTIDPPLKHDYPARTKVWPVLFGRPIKEQYSAMHASRARETVSIQFDARQINATAFDDFGSYAIGQFGEDESSSSEGISGFNFYWSFDDVTLSPGVFDITDENYGLVANAYPPADCEVRAGLVGNSLHLIRQPFFDTPSFNTPIDARLGPGSSGVTVAFWFNVETIGASPTNVAYLLTYFSRDVVENILSVIQVSWFADGSINLHSADTFNSYDASFDASSLSFGDWHFMVMRWHATTGFTDLWIDNVLKLSINNDVQVDLFAAAGDLHSGYASVPLNEIGFDIDEFGFYGEFLDTTDMTYLYNGGAGMGNPGSFEPTRSSSSSSSS